MWARMYSISMSWINNDKNIPIIPLENPEFFCDSGANPKKTHILPAENPINAIIIVDQKTR